MEWEIVYNEYYNMAIYAAANGVTREDAAEEIRKLIDENNFAALAGIRDAYNKYENTENQFNCRISPRV